MNSHRSARKSTHLFAAAIACMFLTVAAYAQVQTQTSVTHGPAQQTVKVERGEVVYVSGNDLVVKKDDGSLVHFPDVPESTRATVDGKQLAQGMFLELLFRGRKAAKPDPVKNLEKTAPVRGLVQ